MPTRLYLNRCSDDLPAWANPAEAALSEARAAVEKARSALVDAMLACGDASVAEALGKRLDRLADAVEGGAAYGPFAALVKHEWTGGDSTKSENHRRYIETF